MNAELRTALPLYIPADPSRMSSRRRAKAIGLAPATQDTPAAAADLSSAPAATRPAFVSDALLEPLLAEARDRHATYRDSGVPVVSLAMLVVLLLLGWLT